MTILALVAVMSFFSNNAEFIKTSNQQLSQGYAWSKVDCRTTTGDVPAFTMTTVNGTDRICYKLIK